MKLISKHQKCNEQSKICLNQNTFQHTRRYTTHTNNYTAEKININERTNITYSSQGTHKSAIENGNHKAGIFIARNPHMYAICCQCSSPLNETSPHPLHPTSVT